MNQPTTAGNCDAGQALAPVSLLDDDELRKLMDAAERVKPKPTPPAAKDLVMEMYEVVGTLWEKGMTHRLLKLCQSLEKDADMRLEWIAREIQQMPDMGGGKPYEWEKLDDRDKDNWRMRADEAARRMASNAKLTDAGTKTP